MWLFYVIAAIWTFDVVDGRSEPRTAFIEIDFCERTKQGSSVYSEKLEGKFANIGSLNKAQGDVLQIHPFGLCNISNSDAFYEDEWVGVVKLTVPSRESQPCNGTVQKAFGAIKKGAKAVIFDITDNPGAAYELNSNRAIVRQPVIIMNGGAAKKMMQIVSRQKVLKAKISWQLDNNQTRNGSNEYVDMVIFMTCFILITLTCFVLLLKIKWKQTKKESSLAKMAFHAVSKMESKKYAEENSVETVKTMFEKRRERKSSILSCSVAGFSCVICLEEFKDGQEIRVVSCGHEFHLKCVDPWLLTNYTCPLCMLNIVEREGNGIKTENRCSLSFRHLFRCCFTSTSLSSSSMVYSVALDETSNDGVSFSSNDTVESLHFNPILASSSHTLWQGQSYPHTSGEPDRSLAGTNAGSQHASCPVIKTPKEKSSQHSLKTQPCQVGVLSENIEQCRQFLQEMKALQIADRGITKYSDLGDAV